MTGGGPWPAVTGTAFLHGKMSWSGDGCCTDEARTARDARRAPPRRGAAERATSEAVDVQVAILAVWATRTGGREHGQVRASVSGIPENPKSGDGPVAQPQRSRARNTNSSSSLIATFLLSGPRPTALSFTAGVTPDASLAIIRALDL